MTAATHEQIEEVLKKPQQYWNSDGIPEIVLGGFWLVWSALLYLPVLFPHAKKVEVLLLMGGMVGMGLGMPRLIRRWKERVTFPRTGYVKLKLPSSKLRWSVAAIAGVIGFGGVLIVRHTRTAYDWVAAIVGVVISIAMVQMAWRVRSGRLALLAPLVAVSGFLTIALELQRDMASTVVFLTAGTIFLLDGLLNHRKYLQAHPDAAGEQR